MAVKKYKVLIEASKILTPHRDGHKRYVFDLLRGLLPVARDEKSPWEFYVYLAAGGTVGIRNIIDIENIIEEDDPFTAVYRKTASFFGPDYILKMLYDKLKRRMRPLKNEEFKRRNRHFATDTFDIIHLTIPQLYLPIFRESFINDENRLITTVHDLTHIHYPHFHSKENIESVQHGLDMAVRRKSVFMTISKSTAHDLLSAFPSIDSTDIHVVYPASDPLRFKRADDPQHISRVMNKYNIPPTPFLLSLCTLEPRKNISNMINAFLLLKKEIPDTDINFVVAGGKGWKYREIFKDKALASDHIIFTGFIEEGDLPVLYSAALALCYVSFYEGFGLPLLEAMCCGTPVIYGNNSSMPEVVGEAGLPADPGDLHDIKEKFRGIVTNPSLREMLSRKALANSTRFSMDIFIQQTIDVYERMLCNDDHFQMNG